MRVPKIDLRPNPRKLECTLSLTRFPKLGNRGKRTLPLAGDAGQRVKHGTCPRFKVKTAAYHKRRIGHW
ncbi:hypothetical protein GCM10025858_28140 [Alicyclobacillus sacchari]|nr:hypothetical protein GCM10025858_28140 [Alicyclobacillus sacchari]